MMNIISKLWIYLQMKLNVIVTLIGHEYSLFHFIFRMVYCIEVSLLIVAILLVLCIHVYDREW